MLFIVQQLCHRYADKEISHGHGEGGGMLSSRHVYGPGKSHLCISAPRVGGERRPVGDSPTNAVSQKDLRLCQPCTLRDRVSVAKNRKFHKKSINVGVFQLAF